MAGSKFENVEVKPPLYRLALGLKPGQIGKQAYLYDQGLGPRRLLRYKTVPISAQDSEVFRVISQMDVPAPLETIGGELTELGLDASILEKFIEAGILVKHVPVADTVTVDSFPRGVYVDRFEQRDMARTIELNTFFNVPTDLGSLKPAVGIKGVPLASISKNKGTEAAPDFIRHISGTFANWFEIHRDGVLSDLCLGKGWPTIAKGIIIADLGDLNFRSDDLATVFEKVAESVEEEFIRPGTKPLFIGGDHAVTFPIVKALNERVPGLGLLHMDAHHDLFFGDQIQYSHASVISNLIFHTGLETIYSFGLRARADLVGQNASALLKLPEAQKWWSRVSTINQCRRYLLTPSLVDSLLEDDLERPFFLTIDLDVLAPEAISGKVMTPVPDGLSWSEFFCLLEILFERLNIIGCDVTELNPYFGIADEQTNEELCLLILYLIEKLGR